MRWIACDNGTTAVAWSQQRGLLAIGHEDGRLVVWNLRIPRKLHEQLRSDRITSLVFSADGKLLFALGSDFVPRSHLLDSDSGRLVRLLPTRGPVVAIPNSNSYVFPLDTGIATFDPHQNKLSQLTDSTQGVVTSMAVDRTARWLAMGSASGTIEMFSLVDRGKGPDAEAANVRETLCHGNG